MQLTKNFNFLSLILITLISSGCDGTVEILNLQDSSCQPVLLIWIYTDTTNYVSNRRRRARVPDNVPDTQSLKCNDNSSSSIEQCCLEDFEVDFEGNVYL